MKNVPSKREFISFLKQLDKRLLEVQNELAGIRSENKRLHWAWLEILRIREEKIQLALIKEGGKLG